MGVRCAFSSRNNAVALNLPSRQTTAWRAVVRVLRSTAGSLASVLFPADCRLCGDPLVSFSRVPVCDSCWANLPAQTGLRCSRCGEPLGVSDFGEGAGVLCRVCRQVPPPFERAVAHGSYADTLRALVHLLKYDGMEPIAARLGALLAKRVAVEDLPSGVLVVPVPLHARRRRSRGFNQSELLARALCATLSKLRPGWSGEVAPKALVRRWETASQTGLNARQRRLNLRGAFSAPKPDRLRGRDVLLVDDVYTTGATARACSQALQRAGAARVWVATVARTTRQEFLPGFALRATSEPPMEQDVALWDESRASA